MPGKRTDSVNAKRAPMSARLGGSRGVEMEKSEEKKNTRNSN